MKIVELTKNLASEASRIYIKSWQVAYKDIIPRNYLDNLSFEKRTALFGNSPFHNFLLQDNDVFVATSSISKARDIRYSDYGEIVSIYVLPEYFRIGYGTALFNSMIEKLQSMGLHKIYLWVLEKNHNARRFYQKMGFVPNGDTKIANIGGEDLTEICYVNRL